MKTETPSRLPLNMQPVDRIHALPAVELSGEKSHIDLKLDANEGPLLSDFDRGLTVTDDIRQYPSRMTVSGMLADRFGLSADQVLVTCGGDDAIDRVCRAFLEPGRNIVVTDPTFPMIPHFAQVAGADVRQVPWTSGQIPVDDIIRMADGATSVIALVSPNNPTGNTMTTDELLAVGSAVPHAVLLVDQAYAEFEDEEHTRRAGDLTAFALKSLANAVVIRTFSKAWGMAGLRVGYAMGHRQIIELLNRVGGPYPVSGPALNFARMMLQSKPTGDRDYLRQVRCEREQLAALLNESGAEAFPSQANFVYVRFGSTGRTAAFVWQALDALGIAVRAFRNDPQVLRITCPGNPQAFARLVAALQTILAPEAILFDMDGVLVDESTSYREAIRLTCQDYGVPVTMQEIAEKKLCGDANNDWIFTHRLLGEKGIDRPFEEVKTRYEGFYQGDGRHHGVWQTEKPLVDPEWLRKLSQRFTLGIVTGRPRRDAIRFLANRQLIDRFAEVICMEDGPAKPDPANVLTALKRLGTTRAWMVGDTPDDINAARGAGVVPLGIVAPKDDPAYAVDKLKTAGAAVILDQLEAIDRYLA